MAMFSGGQAKTIRTKRCNLAFGLCRMKPLPPRLWIRDRKENLHWQPHPPDSELMSRYTIC